MRVVSVLMLLVAVTAAQQFAVRRPPPQRRQQFLDGTPFISGPPTPQRFRPRPPPPGPRRPPNTFFRNPPPVAPVRRPVAPPPPRPPPVEFQAQPDNFQSQRPEPTRAEFDPFPIPSHLGGGTGGLPLNPRPEFNNPSFEPSEGPMHPGEDILLDDSDFITGANSEGPPTPPEGFLSEDPQLQLQAKSSPKPFSTSRAPAVTPQTLVTVALISNSSVPPPTTATTTTAINPVPIVRQSQQQQQRQEVLVEVARPQRQSPPAPRPFNNHVAPTAPPSQPPPSRRQFRPEPLESNDIHSFGEFVPRQEAQEAREQLLQQGFHGDYQDSHLRPDYFYEDNVEYDGEVDNEDEEEKPDRLALLLLNSTFTCVGMKDGYYADEEVQCEVFHYCQDNIKHSWLCPEGASFHQVHLICMPRTEDNICEKSSKFHFVNDFLYKELEVEYGINSSKSYADRYYPEDFEEGLAHLDGRDSQAQGQPPVRHSGQQQQRVPTGVVFHNADEVDIPFVSRHPHPFDGPRLPHSQPRRSSDYDDFIESRRQQG